MIAVPQARQLAIRIRRGGQFRGRYIVVKLGGAALENASVVRQVLTDIILLSRSGAYVVLVPGGGKSVSRTMVEQGIEPRFIWGRRYTCERTLEIATRVLEEQIGLALVDDLARLGGEATLLSYTTGNVLTAARLELPGSSGKVEDLGHVGEVTAVDSSRIGEVIAEGRIPVIPSLALDRGGRRLNVNADDAASALARFLEAQRLVFFSDVPGICLHSADSLALCTHLDAARCRQLVADGMIRTGMVPKVEAALEALSAGVERVHILDGRVPHALLAGLYWGRVAGTDITI